MSSRGLLDCITPWSSLYGHLFNVITISSSPNTGQHYVWCTNSRRECACVLSVCVRVYKWWLSVCGRCWRSRRTRAWRSARAQPRAAARRRRCRRAAPRTPRTPHTPPGTCVYVYITIIWCVRMNLLKSEVTAVVTILFANARRQCMMTPQTETIYWNILYIVGHPVSMLIHLPMIK